ncbi:hypothetical protein ACTPGW_002614 [Enterococcus faecalis]
MKKFGVKPKDGDKIKKTEKRKRAKKNKRVFKNPQDVKLYYRMPILLIIGVVFIVAGWGIVVKNDIAYNKLILASSMEKGEPLALVNGTSEGTLTLGNKMLSADGKTLAIEIKYNEQAHTQLSSFGENYNLYLIETPDSKMKNAKLSYGMFGTDGSGVLTVTSPEGFKDKAFMVFILDKGVLISTDDLKAKRTMSNGELKQSLAKQLAQIDAQDERNNSQITEDKERIPPTYMLRLNGTDAEQSYRNWTEDKEIVEDLFVDRNLELIKKDVEDYQTKIDSAEGTLDEMERRLEKNPDDNTALTNKQDILRSLERLEQEKEKAEANFAEISKSKIEKDILSPKQEKFDDFIVNDLNNVQKNIRKEE